MKKALHIKTDGTVIELDLSKDSLEKLQEAVGGLVQAIDILHDLTMWCNEEGKLIGLPFNPYGQDFWVSAYGDTDWIVGDIVLTGGCDHYGRTLGLSDEATALITVAMNRLRKMRGQTTNQTKGA